MMLKFLLIYAVIFFVIRKIPTRYSGLNCDPTGGVLTAALIIGTGVATADAQVKQGQAQKNYYDYLSKKSTMEGESALAIASKKSEIAQDYGSQQVKAAAIRGAELLATQKVAGAAAGVYGSGSAQDIAIDTMRKTKLDEIDLKYNADTKSWALDTEGKYAKWQADEQSKQYSMAGKQALSGAKRAAAITLLGTATSVATFGAMGGFSSQAGSGIQVALPQGGML